MRLPESYRDKLKDPLGILIPDHETTRERIEQEIPDNSYLVTVGDRTTENLIKFGIIPSLQITDGLERRRPRPHPDLACGTASDNSGDITPHTTIIEVENPPAEITPQSVSAIRRAFSSRPPVRIRVRGEEDLLVVPVCVYAPDNATVLYGQPNEGLVITVITNEVKNKTKGILDLMGRT